ncbi:MAG: rhomboid family intramembrane serine protease, partial [Aureibaculum sp.]
VKEEISWEGHLSGFIVGLLFALYYRKHGPKPQKYEWEDEDYLDEEIVMLEQEKNQEENNDL